MIPGLSGTLLSVDALEHVVPDRLHGRLDELNRGRARRRLRAWHVPAARRARTGIGAAHDLRSACDAALFRSRISDPSARAGGEHRRQHGTGHRGAARCGGTAAAALVVTAWGRDPASAWRDAVRHGIGHGVRWCFCLTGPSLRVVDAVRTYSRRFVEFDLAAVADNDRTFAVFWGLLRADAMRASGGQPLLDRAVAISEAASRRRALVAAGGRS